MNIVQFCLSVFDTDIDTVHRCLNKANVTIYYNKCVLIADDKYIYYFGKAKEVPTITAYRIAKAMSKQMNNKLLYSKDISMYKSHCTLVDDTETEDGKVYRWHS